LLRVFRSDSVSEYVAIKFIFGNSNTYFSLFI